jgi:hypothetical protein
MDAEMKQYLEGMEERLTAAVEKVETSLLTEFYKWGRTSDIRTRQAMDNVSGLNERMLNAEDRITALERSKLPPQAA